MKPIGKIEQVELRKVWPNEAHDFTKWLSEEDGLQLLADAVGLELEGAELVITIDGGPWRTTAVRLP